MKVCICIPLVSRNLGVSFVHKLIVFHWTTRCACYSRNVLLLFVKRKYVAHTMHRWGMSLEKKHAGQFFVSPLQTLWVICSFSGAPKKGVLRACILSWRLVWFFWKTGVGVLWRMVANPFRCAYSDWLQHVCFHNSLLVHLFLVWETMLLENLLCWICWEVENIFCFVHYQNSRSSVPVHEYFTPILVLALYVWLICGQCYSCTWKWHFQNNNLAPVYNITLFVLGQFHFVFQLPPCLHAKQILYQDLFPFVCCLYGLECIQN